MTTRTPLRDQTNRPYLLSKKENAEKISFPKTSPSFRKKRESDEIYKTADEWELLEELESDKDKTCVNDETIFESPLPISGKITKQSLQLDLRCTKFKERGPQHHSTPTPRESTIKDLCECSHVSRDFEQCASVTPCAKKKISLTSEGLKTNLFDGKKEESAAEKNDSKLEGSKMSSVNTLDEGFLEDKTSQNSLTRVSVLNEFDPLSQISIKEDLKEEEDEETNLKDQTVISNSFSVKESADTLLDITNNTKDICGFVPVSRIYAIEKELDERNEEIILLTSELKEAECRVIHLVTDLEKINDAHLLEVEAVTSEKEEECKLLKKRLQNMEQALEEIHSKQSTQMEELRTQLEKTEAKGIKHKHEAEATVAKLEEEFTDTYAKYEKSKEIIDRYKDEIETLYVTVKRCNNMIRFQNERHRKVKEEARREIEIKNNEIKSLKKAHEKNLAVKDETYNSLFTKMEEELKGIRENTSDLTVICDNLLRKLKIGTGQAEPEKSNDS